MKTLPSFGSHGHKKHCDKAENALSIIQAFGAKNYKFVGLVYQRVLVIMAVTATPICAVLLAAKPLLMLGGQSQEVAETTAAYIRCAAKLPC